MTFTFRSLQKSLFTPAVLPVHQKSPSQSCFLWLLNVVRYGIFFMCMLFASSVTGQSGNLPNFTHTVGTVLSNTNGNWVRVDPAQPNNIDLLESRIFKTPDKSSGIAAIEFKIVGADGGTANFLVGAHNRLANGGRGGEVAFSLNLANSNAYDRPFVVTFGKKGESTKIYSGAYCTGGGGGSTGMSWLSPGVRSVELNNTAGYLLAAAGGGSGGFASESSILSGNSSTGDASSMNNFNTLDTYESQNLYSDEKLVLTLVAGGSSLLNYSESLNINYCCTNELKKHAATSLVHSVFNYQTGVILGGSNSVLQSVTIGQGGGKPTTPLIVTQGTSNYTGLGITTIFSVTQNGGRGGSGFAGGGAGSATTTFDYTDGFANTPTSGAGGTGSIYAKAFAQKYPLLSDAGWNTYYKGLSNVNISSRTSTAAPQSGYFMYRTIADTEPPVINVSSVTINVGNGKSFPLYLSATPLTMATLEPYIGKTDGIYDNGAIKSISFDKTELTCNDVGQVVPINIVVTDFAGNSTIGQLLVTVKDPFTPVATFEQSTNIFDPDQPKRIDVTSKSYTLTGANFPKGYDGCKGNNVTIHFPSTTFDCSHAGSQPVTYYYTDSDGNRSPDYIKTFNVVYTASNKFYVDHTATGANNGSSWADAFASLQDALRYGCSNSGREIYVAKGTYYPAGSDRNATFTLRENDKVYGGFPNGGDVFANRKPETNPVILSGELVSTLLNDNSYHVVTIAGNNTLLEGITIRDGYADGNTGGGLLLKQTETALSVSHRTTIRNCKFLNNYAYLGGAVYSDHRNESLFNYLDFINCIFEGNTANDGGAVHLNNQANTSNMRQSFINCVFRNNSAILGGGAIYVRANAEASMTNCTFGYNTTSLEGGALYNLGTTKLHNSILYFNTAGGSPNGIGGTGVVEADYSNIQGSGGSNSWSMATAQDKGHNIDSDPLFYISPFSTLPALTLSLQSLCRNTGTNAHNNELYDATGYNVRVSQDVIDMGAYETNSVVYVAADAPAGGDGNTWATAFNNLNEGIEAAGIGIMQRDVWIKEGIYRPDRIANPNSTPTPNNRENTFYIRYTLKIYGGFAGNETSISQRNIGLHPTILSGDLGVLNNNSDNAYHVLFTNAGDSRLDGLIIEGGNANGDGNYSSGGGIFEYPAGNVTNKVVNCVFRNNHATGKGGAVYVAGNALQAVGNFVQCLFYGNTAARGAASFVQMERINADAYDQNYYNITAVGNVSSNSGAGAFEAAEIISDRPVKINFYNSLLAGNTPQNYSDTGNPGRISLSNTYTAAILAGIFVNTSNPAGADGKIMTADDGLQLASSSPAISYGDNALAYSGISKDVTGSDRVVNRIDAGAYESPYYAPLMADNTGIIYVRPTNAGTGNGNSWANATADLHNAIHTTGVQKVFVAAGNYKVGDHSFIMKNGVAIYGGFDPDNGITDLSHKRIMPAPTNTQGSILDGENVRPVIWNIFDAGTAMNNTAVLDGFMITKGAYSNGAGIRNVYASPAFNNLVITNNTATVSGGGIFNDHSSPLLTNTFIGGNGVGNGNAGATVYGAGAASIASSAPVFTNVTITGNILVAPLGTMKGAGIYSNNSSPKIFNSIIWNNQKMTNPSIPGADLENDGTVSLTLKNCITQIYNTGNASDNNKVSVNPQLTSEYRLTATSPAVDAGDNSFYTTLNADTKDLAGNLRVTDFANNKSIDIGAYESQRVITRWYVSAAQDTLPGDGSSWATAFIRFKDGLAAAKAGDTVFVAKGIYMPEVAGEYFSMKHGVKIYGGFAATEQTLEERNLGLGNNAVLSGNGNSVIVNTDVNNGALLDGFVIQNGNAATKGGGVRNTNTQATFRNLVFANNKAADGGAVANISSETSFQNAVFYSNAATQNGGAISDNASATTVLHATFYQNSAQNGAVATQQDGSSLTMENSVVWGNTSGEWHSIGAASTSTITYSLLQTSHSGVGNIAGIDPKFSYADNPAGFDGQWFTGDDGLTATAPSRFVNTGSNTLSVAINKDLTGAQRLQNGIVDMGAYESALVSYCESITANGNSTLYVNAGVSASGNGLSWSGALKTLNEALEIANYCTGVETILITEGNYYPTGYKEGDDRAQSFVLSRGNIHLSGGFSSYDPTIRNTGSYQTILSGNINEDGVAEDNSFHVITVDNASNNVVLDGLTIRDGRADGVNVSEQYGGGIYNLNGSGFSVSNSVVANNAAVLGGGFYNQSADPTFTNVAFTGNTASNQGGGFYNVSGNPVFTNVTFGRNTAATANSGSVGIASGAAELTNTIVYGGMSGAYSSQYSLIEGSASTANGNVDATGMSLVNVFSDPDKSDYTLKACSPATNAGTPDESALDLPAFDLAGSTRIFADRVDIGAYENTILPDKPGLAQQSSKVMRAQTRNGATHYFNSCNELLASVETTGITNNVEGITMARVWIDNTQPAQYVKRHYEVTPDQDAENAVGKVTLYFTQADFNAFNAVNSSAQLPDGPSGNVSRLLIEKRGGVSSDGAGNPMSYSGATETISNVDVLWNGDQERWEVSFTTAGFSGFFVKTANAPLPVRLIAFEATLNEAQKAVLDWKADERNAAHYEVERSSNARDFWKVGTVASQGNGLHTYRFTDPVAVYGNVYYRMKLVDADGTYTYSRIVRVAALSSVQLKAYPNPTRKTTTVELSPEHLGSQVRLVNAAGILLQQITVHALTFTLSLDKYPAGIYVLYMYDGKAVKLIKE